MRSTSWRRPEPRSSRPRRSIVEKLFFSDGGGGITAYVRSPDRQWIYYYAHLQAYAPGLREGQRVARGDRIGLVGSTGNANPEGPHLHFAVHRMARANAGGRAGRSIPTRSLPGAGRAAKAAPHSSNPASIPMKISGVDIRPGNIIEYEAASGAR